MERSTLSPFVLPYGGVSPSLAEPIGRYGPGSAVLGRATIGSACSLASLSVVRADGHYVNIGDEFWLGEHSTVHIAHEIYPCIIGDRVTVGSNACVHACTVGNDCVIEDHAVILDGSIVQDGVVLEAGSVVFPRSQLEAGYVYAGVPAKPIRQILPDEVAKRAHQIRSAAVPELSQSAIHVVAGSFLAGQADSFATGVAPSTFVAATARIRGSLYTESNASIWFGCVLDAGEAEIRVGRNSNIQDNTSIHCTSEPLILGRDAVIGHNAKLSSCTIGDRALIGIGSLVAEGTIVESDVLLAAGARTIPGQRLESGWVWAGNPARPIGKLDAKKHEMIAWTVKTYTQYAQDYLFSQEHLLRESV
jgi:carbonic anhydrase/acetyltransferase-like protein (isoleucine patch superfamily)